MSSTTSPQATWKLLGLKKPCQNSKSIVPFKWWHPQWEKILDFMHQWHELQALDYINRLKISLKLFNFCLVVLGFIWCQRQGLPLNNDTGAISIKCLIHWPARLPRQVRAVLLSLFPGLTGYCLLVGSSSLLLQLSITNVPVILCQKPNFLKKKNKSARLGPCYSDGIVSTHGFRPTHPCSYWWSWPWNSRILDTDYPVGLLAVGSYPTWLIN